MDRMDNTYLQVGNYLRNLHKSVGDVLRQIKNESPANSHKTQELSSLKSQYLEHAYNQVEAIIFYKAADHLDAIGRTLTPPILTYSPWASARCVLEACSLAYWLADTDIDFKERTCRILNVELKSTKDGLSYLRSIEDISAGVEVGKDKSSIEELETTIGILRETAREIQISEKCNRKGRLMGFGDGLPTYADLADIAFGAGDTYRLLSGATHGESWAHFISTEARECGDVDSLILEPSFREESALHIAIHITEWYAKSVWRLTLLSGWNLKMLARVLEEEYDKLSVVLQSKYATQEISDEKRFWRKDYVKMVLQ